MRVLGDGRGEERGVSGVQKCLHIWESPKGFFLERHTSSGVPAPGSALRMG